MWSNRIIFLNNRHKKKHTKIRGPKSHYNKVQLIFPLKVIKDFYYFEKIYKTKISLIEK